MTEYHSKEFQPIAGGLTTTGKVNRPDKQEGYCFAIKAVDENGYTSEFSENEEGDGNDCDHNPNDLPFIEDNGNPQVSSSSGGGGGGGCFIDQIR